VSQRYGPIRGVAIGPFSELDTQLAVLTGFPMKKLPPVDIYIHQVVIARPGGLVFPSRRVTLWTKRLGKKAESYEAYRVRVAEDIVLGIDADPALADTMRKQRGMLLALNPRIKQVGLGLWHVPSSTNAIAEVGAQVYTVDTNARTCNCPDFERRKKKCKHQYAVEWVSGSTSTNYQSQSRIAEELMMKFAAAAQLPSEYLNPAPMPSIAAYLRRFR
jgi:hypothetical protein